MKKLSLKLDNLHVQSFHTTPAGVDGRGTVLGHLDDGSYGEQACTDACSLVLTCATCDTCDEACDPTCTDDGVDANRRIIVY